MKRFFHFSAIALLLTLSACSTEEEPQLCDNPEVVIVDGDFNFDQPVTFRACTVYYFTEGVDISSTLTIEPGAILKFKDISTWAGLSLSNNATGRIIALGTAQNPIIFTSDKDDAHGGDSNGDGSGTSPQPGDWNGVYIVGNGSEFEHCKFLYGGQSSALMELYNVDATFDHCTFAYSKGDAALNGDGVFYFGWGTENARLTNSIFYGNIKPISMNSNTSLDGSNTFHNPENPSETNTYNGVFVEQSSNQVNITWEETEVPFVYCGVGANQALGTNFDPWTFTIAPGVIIKFASLSNGIAPGIWLRSDNSSLVNSNATGVYFTSYKDDAHGGDTNGDGNASLPMQGDWDGIYDAAADINPPDHYYSWGNILYAGN